MTHLQRGAASAGGEVLAAQPQRLLCHLLHGLRVAVRLRRVGAVHHGCACTAHFQVQNVGARCYEAGSVAMDTCSQRSRTGLPIDMRLTFDLRGVPGSRTGQRWDSTKRAGCVASVPARRRRLGRVALALLERPGTVHDRFGRCTES